VYEVSASNDQHPFITQAGESLGSFVVELRWLRVVDTELYDGDICFRKDVAKHGPGSVI
jgi:hypothetical protein